MINEASDGRFLLGEKKGCVPGKELLPSFGWAGMNGIKAASPVGFTVANFLHEVTRIYTWTSAWFKHGISTPTLVMGCH